LDKGLVKPIRIDLCFTGCCDASLALVVDESHEGDLTVETEGLSFIISPETYELSGDIHITHTDEAGTKGFSITSSKPVSEWDGFGICNIKI
jgi:Fe-S cluster assembly iron-binding protein IscA